MLDLKQLNKSINAQNAEINDVVRRALSAEVRMDQTPVALAIAQLKTAEAIYERLGDLLEVMGMKR